MEPFPWFQITPKNKKTQIGLTRAGPAGVIRGAFFMCGNAQGATWERSLPEHSRTWKGAFFGTGAFRKHARERVVGNLVVIDVNPRRSSEAPQIG
jgi:hypothetical protein